MIKILDITIDKNELIGGLILAFIIFLVGISYKFLAARIGYFFKSKGLFIDGEYENDLSGYQKYYVEAGFYAFDADDKPVVKKSGYGSTKLLDYFNEVIIPDPLTPFCLVSAPTGVGKTTFLANLFLSYSSKSKFTNKAEVYYGNVHNPNTKQLLKTLIDRGEASKCILFLDALDEYETDTESTDKYWRNFIGDWNELKQIVSQFKKVIITVRDQFLVSPDIERTKIFKGTIPRKALILKLQPFDMERRREYLEKRFVGQKLTDLVYLTEDLIKQGLSFLEVPLILNFIEEIWDGIVKNQNISGKSIQHLSYYQLFDFIVKNWIQREKDTKGLHDNDAELLFEFCVELAKVISLQNKFSIVSDELLELENRLGINKILKGLSDRSLLVRVKSGRNDIQYKFIHNTFLEFFLVKALEIDADFERSINFNLYPIAAQLLVGRRWSASDFPRANHPMLEGRRLDTKYDILPATYFEEWVNLFESLSCNIDIQVMLQSNLEDLLSTEDSGYSHRFKELNKLTICNQNFWDDIQGKPIEATVKFLSYLPSYLVHIHLDRKPVADEMLACFEKCKNIRDIAISNAELTGEGLKYFLKSLNSVIVLYLNYNKITDAYLEVFKDKKKMRLLGLSGNKVTGKGVKYFASNWQTLERLYLADITDIKDEDLEGFRGAKNIVEIDLSSYKIDGSRINGSSLKYFYDSLPHLVYIYLCNTGIDPKNFTYFQNCYNLRYIDICKNSLTASDFSNFRNSFDVLENIHLSGNPFGLTGIELLSDIPNLKELKINGCPLETQINSRGLSQQGLFIHSDV